MAALLLKSYGRYTLRCLRHTRNCDGIGYRTANFHFTANSLQAKCDDSPAYTTRLALPPDYESVVEFMCEEFYKHEPAVINIGLQGTEAPNIWRAMMHDQVKAGLSIIAEGRDNCIVGAALNVVTDEREAEKLYNIANCCECGPIRNLIEFFGFIAEIPKIFDRFCVKRVFELCSLAVRSDHQNMGIATRLIQESWFLARDCGYQIFRLDCNSNYCARIARSFGWPMIFDIPFSQYVKDGKVIFEHVKEPHTVCQVYVDYLLYCKTFCVPNKQCKTVTSSPTDVKEKEVK